MSKLFINLLFVYVLLFHFVSNKDRFFIRQFNNKWEFTIDEKTQSGSAFYKFLKDWRAPYTVNMQVSRKFVTCKSPLHLSPDGASQRFGLGSIISSADELKIVITDDSLLLEKFEQIGEVTEPERFVEFLNKLKDNRVNLQFELVKDQTVARRPRNLGEKKTKLQTSVLKRTIKDKKPEYFWRNIGWKILKSLQSLFS